MARLRPLIGLALLAVLTVGGTIIPEVHRAAHAEETAHTRQRHAASEHHHHDGVNEHGLEAVPSCPEPLADHAACVLCATHATHILVAQTIVLAPEATKRRAVVQERAPGDEIRAAHGARGPPAEA